MSAPGGAVRDLDALTMAAYRGDALARMDALLAVCKDVTALRAENARLREAAAEVLAEFDALDAEAQEQPGCGGLPETGGIVLLRAALGDAK